MAAIGRVLLMPKGAYSGGTVYNALDWVRHDSKAWVCKVDGTVGIVPSEGANWTLLAADGSVSGSVAWIAVTGKPFDDVDSTDFDVDGSNNLIIKRDTFGTMRIVSAGTTTNLEASGDSVFEIDAGTNVTIAADDTANPKKITINASGGTSSVAWGGITGTLSDQSDLNTALNGKADDTELDGWSTLAYTDASGVVTFTLNDSGNYDYDPYADITPPLDFTIKLTQVTGKGTSSCTLTYQTTGLPTNTACKLRILK